MNNNFKSIILILFIIFLSYIYISCNGKSDRKENINVQEKYEHNDESRSPARLKLKEEDGRNNIEYKSIDSTEYYPIGSYETRIIDKSEGRVYNLSLASSKLNGQIIESGEVFSFNRIVGEADEANGFKKAKVLIQKEAIMDDGGGVCQVSSTLYNSALFAGMQIIERHSHSRDVGYIDLGKDAAISYGKFDLKFKNTKPFPVKIEARVEGERMVVKLWNEASKSYLNR